MILDTNTIILTINFLLYCFWFVFSFRAKKRITPYNFLILWTSFISFMSIVTYMNGIYADTFMSGDYNLPNIDPIGLFVVFISFVILFLPLKNLEISTSQKIKIPNNFKYFELFAITFFFIFCIIQIPYLMRALLMDAIELYTNLRKDGEHLLPKHLLILSTLASLLFYFLLPYCFYQIRDRISFKYVLLIILLFVFVIERGVISASRGSLFLSLGTFIFSYLLFYHLYSKKVRKITFRFFVLFTCLFGILGIGITVSRIAESTENSSFESIQRYFGESYNNFSFQVWRNPDIVHTYGESDYPGIYSFMTGTKEVTFNSAQDRIDYIESITHTEVMNNFVPMYGHLYVEFGPIFSLIFIIVVSFLINIFLKNRLLELYQLPIIIYLFQFLYFYSPISNMFKEATFKHLLYVVIISFFLKKLLKPEQNDQILDRNPCL